MSPREKQLWRECHPDRNGGDHSRLEKLFAFKHRSYVGLAKAPRHCQWPGCGVAIAGISKHCNVHWRQARKPRLTAALFLLGVISIAAQPLPLPASLAPKVESLTWVGPTNAQDFQVCIGPARGTTTNAFITTTNRIAVQPGAHYMIRARDFNVTVPPAVSAPVYWPRYPVVRLVNEVFETPGGPKIGEQVWLTYTSSIAGEPTQKFQRLRSETIRWE